MASHMQSSDYNGREIFKIVLVGDSQVGKTAIMLQFVESVFATNSSPTIGVSWCTKVLTWKGRAIMLQVWDTAGQERFSSLAPLYCRKADAVLMVYDITKLESFHNINSWFVKARIPVLAHIVLVGNKLDVCEKRVVTTAMGQSKARELRPEGAQFFETSAKSNTNIDDLFQNVVSHLVSMGDTRHSLHEVEAVKLDDHSQIPMKSSCCSRVC